MIPLQIISDGSVADRNFLTLLRLVIDTGGLSVGIRFGMTTLTWTAATASATVSQAHGLPGTPSAVFAASWWIPGVAAGFSPVKAIGATTFDVRGETGPGYGAFSGSVAVGWIAIG